MPLCKFEITTQTPLTFTSLLNKSQHLISRWKNEQKTPIHKDTIEPLKPNGTKSFKKCQQIGGRKYKQGLDLC